MAWVNERFALANGLLFFVLFCAAVITARASTSTEAVGVSPFDVVRFFGVWGFFLLLRVYDEHKDYAEDLHNYPDRVLQSGLITLTHLKWAGVIAVAIQLGVSLHADQGFGPATITWLATFAYSVLMAKEFFIGDWLEQRLLLYALSHMAIMPLALVWMAHLGAGGQWMLPEHAAAIATVGVAAFCTSASFEIIRKTRAPEEERPSVPSYARDLGLRAAAWTSVACFVGCAASLGGLLWIITDGAIHPAWFAGFALSVLIPALAVRRFLEAPSPEGRESNEKALAAAILLVYVLFIAGALVTLGARFTVA